ncbi:CAMK family protein kinase [Tritrichomonas foetus]|uniref:CAMK family protein kinase n=1 Tax=Tritrichomonas foetus TaxID=1144522 RepID=A0A1J4JWA9_9EUKA|nr:CAMK family protein kinase [Tritrichomonas foetus]|eukprot:OHT02728.1 CAMK family protein kinase [Tritrichomonas foetus]
MSLNQTIVAPSIIGPYTFRGTVGTGAFSVVKLSFNRDIKEFFACKIVPRNRLSDDDLESRFESEIRINQQMHHSGVVQIVDLLKDDLNYYIFMEFCPNGELFKYIIEKQRLTEPEAGIFMYQFLDAIKYVHSLGVAHRDLKPENLLLDPNGRLKISDFGLSKFVGQSGIVDTPCGSPCYASPECLSGSSYDGRMSDLWSIGVILFAMVTGQLPWTKRNQAQLFNQIRHGEYTIPNYLSEDCQDLIRRLMTVDVNQRITVEEALNHPWIKQFGNLADECQDTQQNFQIVSLKKVDRFFEKTTWNDMSLNNFENKENLSILNKRILHKDKSEDFYPAVTKIHQKLNNNLNNTNEDLIEKSGKEEEENHKTFERNVSQKVFTFKAAVHAIKDNSIFPGVNHQKQGITQSLKFENKHSAFDAIDKQKPIPSSSFGAMPPTQLRRQRMASSLVKIAQKRNYRADGYHLPHPAYHPHLVLPKGVPMNIL